MDPADAGPPPKRRRTSSPRPAPRRSSLAEDRHPAHSPPAPRAARRNPLEGFNDEEDLPDEEDRRSDGDRGLEDDDGGAADGEDDEEHCAVCLSPIENKTVVSPCHHGQFCWNCIRAWTDQSRKCPLCLGPIEHLIHNIRSASDYQIHYLLPLHALSASTSSSLDYLPPRGNRRPRVNPTLPRHALYGRNRFSSSARLNNEDETTWRERQEQRALERRRYIYREDLYAKHVASNRYTGFKPFSPQTFVNNADLKAKVIKFIRRELQVFPTVDIAFLTTYLVSIASQLDLRSSAAIRLISDFLSEQDAQHLVHEITTFARSPFTTLEGYDRFVQYGRPAREIPKAKELEALVHDVDELSREAPRFEEHMRRRRAEDEAVERARPKPPPPMSASLPGRPSEETRRRASQGDAYRNGGGDSGYGERRADRRRSPSPNPSVRERTERPRPKGYRRSPSPGPSREPSWRDRDERYTGSYYVSTSATPPPPVEADEEDAISLVGPTFSSHAASPRHSSPPAEEQQADTRPMISIFGAARRLLGNGRVVTVGADGRASLQSSAEARAVSVNGASKGRVANGQEATPGEGVPRPQHQEPYDAAPSRRPASSAGKSLLARLGGVADTSAPPSTASSSPANDADSLRAKLQARLTAEYREALASRSSSNGSNGTATVAGKSDLRSLLQTRLQAEKALAYEELTRAKVQASLAASRSARAEHDEERTTYSQATRDLLMARLEEERLLHEGVVAGGGGLTGYDFEQDYSSVAPAVTSCYAAPRQPPSTLLSQPPPPPPVTPPAYSSRRAAAAPPAGSMNAAKSETSLKAALLEKRKAAVEDELKKRSGELKERLMRQKLLAIKAGKAGSSAAVADEAKK
ncbi:hypothetical protein Rhopal_000212-T1 [Rhodotorula paludigena]|uniref:RING-type E3 ubiquitin transferase n=1 Tax=Rhodotorula paludigena TaxID=86838 RepID=A0AAV5GA09_9BASI|nr:hypothetical protein Rhopal_000212-T1 [Rhodotorula paludigena]